MIDVNIIQKIIPHRYPFLLVDRVENLVEYESIEAYKNVTIAEQIFQGHFPGHPIYPGVMIIEGMAQAGALLAFISLYKEKAQEENSKIVYFLSIDKAKFRQPVVPGDKLVYKLKTLKQKGSVWVIDAKGFVDDKLVSEAELKAMIVDK